jgi:DNA-binding response OmpR family regulator
MPVTTAEEIECLRFRITELEEQIGIALQPPTIFGLSRSETAVLGILLANPHPRRNTFMVALYGDRLDPPHDKIIDVMIARIRRRLSPLGIEIVTRWGQGYSMPETSKARAHALMEAA